MPDTNPFAPPSSPLGDVSPRSPPRAPETVGQAMRQGLAASVKWTTYIVGPLMVLLFLFIVAIDYLEARRNGFASLWTTRRMAALATPVALYFVVLAVGVVTGPFLGILGYAHERRLRRIRRKAHMTRRGPLAR
jgi:hypothetical protein